MSAENSSAAFVGVWLFNNAGALYTDKDAHGTRFNTLNECSCSAVLVYTP